MLLAVTTGKARAQWDWDTKAGRRDRGRRANERCSARVLPPRPFGWGCLSGTGTYAAMCGRHWGAGVDRDLPSTAPGATGHGVRAAAVMAPTTAQIGSRVPRRALFLNMRSAVDVPLRALPTVRGAGRLCGCHQDGPAGAQGV